MSTYLLINIGIIVFPLLLSFEKRVSFWRRWPALGLAFLCGGGLYIVWDIIAASLGQWGFNPDHVLPFRIAGLPIEEMLFFVTVPYSTLFVFECLNTYFGEKRIAISRAVIISVSAVLLVLGMVFLGRYYTETVLIFCAAVLAIGIFQKDGFLFSRNYWLYVAVSYVPFIIFNHLLTAIPVVVYNPKAIWGLRVWSIPVEDFFYSFSMLSFYIMFYRFFRDRLAVKGRR